MAIQADEPIFFQRQDRLSLTEAGYFQDLLYRTIKIGTELEFALPKGVRREDFQPGIEKLLCPSKDMNLLGPLGVYDVIKEHCGVEVQIIGRHPHWNALCKQYRLAVTPLVERGIRMRPTCGLHYHLLGTGLAESVPEIILANLWNMARKFAPGLKYITSGGASMQGLCRRRQHNAHLEFMRQSPLNRNMRQIQLNLKNSMDVPEHQNFFNLEHVRFDDDDAIRTFHIEFRFADGDLAPVSITAKTFLFLAMLLKAVEISKFGLLHVGKIREWNRKKELMNMISNNNGKLATSDTSAITPTVLDEYRNNAAEMLNFLKSIFLILDNPAEIVLQELCQCPVSLRRTRGDDWAKIEKDLYQLVLPLSSYDELDHKIIKVIELGLVQGASEMEEWLKQAAIRAGVPGKIVRERIKGYVFREPVWNAELGRMVFLK
ncbi:hypothetical protein QUF90_13475 [Desulfococcaceae bacterium HSG9]|nr:hypothetical protein [Desulfococcaceae bacterium HSG9]